MVKGILAETAMDEDTWYLKSSCQVKNETGQWLKELTCEIYITGTNEHPEVTDFIIY